MHTDELSWKYIHRHRVIHQWNTSEHYFFTYRIFVSCQKKVFTKTLRDRPFNLKGRVGGGYDFLFRSEFIFRTTQELEYLFYLSRKARNFFPQFSIRLYDKNSESDYSFFSPPKSEYFIQQHWKSEWFF